MGPFKSRSTILIKNFSFYIRITIPEYIFAFIKGTVETPTYHYDKDPDVIYTILGQCWRLHYLKCNLAEFAGHPCCQLVSDPGPLTPADNALTRWLDTSRADRITKKKAVMLI